jgi:hypothetical protein
MVSKHGSKGKNMHMVSTEAGGTCMNYLNEEFL